MRTKFSSPVHSLAQRGLFSRHLGSAKAGQCLENIHYQLVNGIWYYDRLLGLNENGILNHLRAILTAGALEVSRY